MASIMTSEAERLAQAWAEAWIARARPYDVSRLPSGPDPDACEHAWFPLLRALDTPHYCYLGCGATIPRGRALTPDEQARARGYQESYSRALALRREMRDERNRGNYRDHMAAHGCNRLDCVEARSLFTLLPAVDQKEKAP